MIFPQHSIVDNFCAVTLRDTTETNGSESTSWYYKHLLKF